MSANPLHSTSELSLKSITTSAGGTVNICAAVAGLRANIYKVVLTGAAINTATFQDTTSNPISSTLQFGASTTPCVIEMNINGDPLYSAAIGLGLQVAISAATAVGIDLWFKQMP